MWITPTVLVLVLLTSLVVGAAVMAAATVIAASVIHRFHTGRAVLTGRPLTGMAEPLPFVIKDDAKELQIEQQHLGYKPIEEFDNIEGLGR